MPDTAKADFIQQQYDFAAHIRNPEQNPAPAGIEDRRMGIYRELFYNNVEGFLSNGFPVLAGITGRYGAGTQWRGTFFHAIIAALRYSLKFRASF